MKKRKWYFLGVLFAAAVLVNIIAWRSKEFCDFYVKNIFPVWLNTYGRLTSLFPFSVGEIMVAAGVVLVAVSVILGFVLGLFILFQKDEGKGKGVKSFCRRYYGGLAGLLVFIFTVMTLNCSVLYHCSTFKEKYMASNREEYTMAELENLRDYVVTRVNALAQLMTRDEYGNILYEGDLHRTAIDSMRNIGSEYDQLAGFYTRPKPFAASEFISQQYMEGYYFPFSLEANYNDVMQIMRKPSTICHELAHTKGFIYEDEANLIGFLACINSEDILFQYSGYLSVLNYLDNDFYDSIHGNKTVYNSHVKISKQVRKDNVFLTDDTWKVVEQNAVVSTETVKTVSTQFIETNLLVNGIEDGSLSYGRVVGLLLDYYDGTELEPLMQESFLVQAAVGTDVPSAR